MKKFFPALLAIVLFCLFPVVKVNAQNVSESTSVTTIGAENIVSFSAVLKGHVTLQSNMASDLKVGFRYSTDPVISASNSKVIETTDADAHNNFTATVTRLKYATKYYFLAFIRINGREIWGETMEFTTLDSPAPEGVVDLGIVMTRKDGSTYNLYWAECNLGASKPEEYGNYYAWGETELKLKYDWSTYKWCNGSDDSFTKYNPYRRGVDNIELDLEDDVANQMLGGKWRMPTDSEWEALINCCEWRWTAQGGVRGYMITGPTGNSIFLPAAGYRYDTGLYDAGSNGYYWSSSLNTDYPRDACNVYFSSLDVSRRLYYRSYGRSVRPVSE